MHRLAIYHKSTRMAFEGGTPEKQRRHPCTMATIGRCNAQIKEGRKFVLVSSIFADKFHVYDFYICKRCWQAQQTLILETHMYLAMQIVKEKAPEYSIPITQQTTTVKQAYRGVAPTQEEVAKNQVTKEKANDIESFNKQIDEEENNAKSTEDNQG